MSSNVLYKINFIKPDSIQAFLNINTFTNNEKNVFFIRAIGECPNFSVTINNLDNTGTSNTNSNYKRIFELPKLSSYDISEKYSNFYNTWKETKNLSCMNPIYTDLLNKVISYALNKTIDIYKTSKKSVTDSMIKSFCTKLFYWLDTNITSELNSWSVDSNIKIVADNVYNEQEYFFYYFLAAFGIDVLLLQNKKDIDLEDRFLSLSSVITLGSFGNYDIPKYIETVSSNNSTASVNNTSVTSSNNSDTPIVISMDRFRRADRHSNSTATDRNDSSPTMPTNPNNSNTVTIDASRFVRPDRNNNIGRNNSSENNNPDAGNNSNNGNTAGTVIPIRPFEPRSNPNSATVSITNNTRTRINNSFSNNTPDKELNYEALAGLAPSIVMILAVDKEDKILHSGSGIMIGHDGYILTNCHVASDAFKYAVRIENDNNFYETREIVKYNQFLDLAIIRISKTLNPLPIYNGNKELVRGQKVVAIGSPLGLFNSVSDGIISGFRKIDNVNMIQFTAPISGGSSGGALLNMYGQVIGISTARFAEGQNINLAIRYDDILAFAGNFMK